MTIGSIKKVLPKYAPDENYYEGNMPWIMRIFTYRNHVIFGNDTEASQTTLINC